MAVLLLAAVPAAAAEKTPLECYVTAIELDRLNNLANVYLAYGKPDETRRLAPEQDRLKNGFFERCIAPRLCGAEGAAKNDWLAAEAHGLITHFLQGLSRKCGS